MKIQTATILSFLICSLQAPAGMLEMNVATYNLTDAKLAGKSAQWNPKERLGVSKKGLGWDGDAKSALDLRLLLQPIAIGHGWRPAGNAGISVQLNFEDEENLKRYFSVYVRYSPNGENWSTWQPLTLGNPAKKDKAKGQPKQAFHYSGRISVPRREMDAYRKKQQEYMKLDVPWASDEHALCEWIVKEDPKFFQKHLPFPGFIQVYIEGSLQGGNRLKSVLVNHSSATSGLHQPAKDPKAEKKREGAWNYWTARKRGAMKPACGFDKVYKSPTAPR